MRRLAVVAVVLLGAIAIIGWRAAPTTMAGPVKATGTINNSSVHGSYAFSETFHDPAALSGQEGNAAGTIVFESNGVLKGVFSQNSRCVSCTGQPQVTRAPISGSYTVYPDGSATLKVCIGLTAPFDTQAIWEGAFSTFFVHFRYIQTTIATPCNSVAPIQSPTVTSGTADKV